MVRAYLLSWGEKGRSLIALFLFAISQIRPGWQPWAVSQNKQASTTTNQFVYWPLKLVSRCACLYGTHSIECI